MSYMWKAPEQERPVLSRERLEQEQAELERLGKALSGVQVKAKGARTRLATAEADLSRVREQLAEVRATVGDTRAIILRARKDAADAVAAAHAEAARVMIEAEREASLIREAAYEQARVLAERAYTSGTERARDAAQARAKVLEKVSAGRRGHLSGVANPPVGVSPVRDVPRPSQGHAA